MSDLHQEIADYLTARHEPENVNIKHRQNLRIQDKVAVTVTTAVGTMYAVYLILLFVSGWMVWQSWADKPIDPFPFAFMVFISNIMQLLLMPLIMVGQNVQGKHAELRAEEEFKRTLSMNKDIEKLLVHMDAQNKLLEELVNQKKSK
jgi:uncharacterized membrane protein